MRPGLPTSAQSLAGSPAGVVLHPGEIGANQEFQFPEQTDLRGRIKRS
jgi:hypothetical protein